MKEIIKYVKIFSLVGSMFIMQQVYTSKTRVLRMRYVQVHNQEFFSTREISWNLGTLIIIHLQHEKTRSRREKISGFFAWKLLKISF